MEGVAPAGHNAIRMDIDKTPKEMILAAKEYRIRELEEAVRQLEHDARSAREQRSQAQLKAARYARDEEAVRARMTTMRRGLEELLGGRLWEVVVGDGTSISGGPVDTCFVRARTREQAIAIGKEHLKGTGWPEFHAHEVLVFYG